MNICIPLLLSLFALYPGLSSASDNRPDQPHIIVQEKSHQTVSPDMATLTLKLENTSPHLKKARDNVEKRSRKLLRYLLRFNLPPEDRVVSELHIQPMAGTQNKNRVTQIITLKIRTLSQYSDVLERIQASQTNSHIRVVFEHSNEEGLKEQVVDSAINKARQKASKMAQRLGQKIGRVFSIEEHSHRIPSEQHLTHSVSSQKITGSASHIHPGQLRFSSQVRVIFLLR